MSKELEPGKFTVKEAFLTRFLTGEDADLGNIALAFVLTLRSNIAEARKKSDIAHKQDFESWQWDVDQDDVVAILQEHGFLSPENETEEDLEAKKD